MAQPVDGRDRRGAAADGSGRVYALWGVALALLVSAGLFCRLVVIPFRETRAAVEAYAKRHHYYDDRILMDSSREELAQLGGPVVAAGRLTGYLRLPPSISPHPRLAIRMLMDCREHSWPYLPRLLRHPESAVRRRAADGLGLSKNPRVVPLLITALRDPDREVRCAAAYALGRIGDPRAFEPLLAGLNEVDLGAVASASLVRTGGARAIRPLCGYLERCWKENWCAGYVVEELVELRDPRAAEALAVALHIRSPMIRVAVGDALVKIGAPAVGYLIDDLRAAEPDRRHSWEVRYVLIDIGQPAVEPLLAALKDRNAEVRLVAVEGLGELQERRAVEPIIELLNDPDWGVRTAAADALGWIKDPRAIELLISRISYDEAGPDEALYFAFTARHALKEIGSPAVPSLCAALGNRDRRMRSAAARVLAGIRDRRALEPLLLVSLSDEDADVRDEAVSALAEIFGGSAGEPLETPLKGVDWHIQPAHVAELERLCAALAGESEPQGPDD